MNNEGLSAASEAGIKAGADGVWTGKHLQPQGLLLQPSLDPMFLEIFRLI